MAAQQELEPVIDVCQSLGWEDTIGASGTIRAVMKITTSAGWTDNDITPAALISFWSQSSRRDILQI